MSASKYMGKIVFICNPVAGNGKAKSVASSLSVILKSRGTPFDLLFTEYPGHATFLSQDAVSENASAVVAIGGDGTLREAALGMIGKGVPLGIIPAGTGNDFVRCLGIPDEPEKALSAVINGKTRSINISTANGNPFINVAGFGFDVDVLDAVEIYKKKYKSGRLAYLMGLISVLKHRQPRDLTYSIDGNAPQKVNALMLAAANGTHFGGGICIAPNSLPDDDLLDFIIIHDVFSIIDVCKVLPALLLGKINRKKKYVSIMRGHELKASCSPESRIQIDGERMPGTPVVFSLTKEKLLFFVPESES